MMEPLRENDASAEEVANRIMDVVYDLAKKYGWPRIREALLAAVASVETLKHKRDKRRVNVLTDLLLTTLDHEAAWHKRENN